MWLSFVNRIVSPRYSVNNELEMMSLQCLLNLTIALLFIYKPITRTERCSRNNQKHENNIQLIE